MKINLSKATTFFFPNTSFLWVFFEAIANAIDSESKKIIINISIEEFGKPETLSVAIIDDGNGFTDENFYEFSRLLETKKIDHKGLGRLVFLQYFEPVEDPRQAAKVLYPFEEILLLVLCAVITGADNWTSIALYGQKKLDVLRRFLPFVDGTPCHDQLGILFSRLDMEQFQQCFVN